MSDLEYNKILEELEELTKTLHWKVSGDLFLQYRDLTNDPDFKHGVKPWSVPKTTGEFLYKIFKERGCKNILEIGTSIGYSTLWIAKAVKEVNGHIDTLEVFDRKLEIAREFFKKANIENTVASHHMRAKDFLQTTTNIYDGVFLDANKSDYVLYLQTLKSKLTQNGVVVIDNAINLSHKFDAVYEYLESLKNSGVTWRLYDLDAGLLVIERIGNV